MARLFDPPGEVAPGVLRLPLRLVNAYLVGEPGGPWALVDAGLPTSADSIRRAAAARYGAGARPEAILLTHGHADHAGSARYLAGLWDVPVYAHALERPYLTRERPYPPFDAEAPGPLGPLSRWLPERAPDLSGRVFALPPGGGVPGLADWRWTATPGHTPGHVCYWRASDRVLLAGDAVATMNLDSALCYAPRPPGLYRPPAPFTSDWAAAEASVRRLADQAPRVVAAGHGRAYAKEDAADRLARLADEMGTHDPEAQRSGKATLVAGAAGAAAGAAIWAFRTARRR